MGQYEFDDDEPYVVIEKHTGSASAFLLGAAIGAGFALLFAPRSGAETRLEIQNRARRVRDRAEDAVEGATDRIADSYESARMRVESRIENARQAVDLKRQQVSRAMEAGRAAAFQARADLERRLAETKAAYRAGMDVARGANGGTSARADADLGDEESSPLDRAAAGDDPTAGGV